VVGERNHLRSRMRTGRRLLPNVEHQLRPKAIERAKRAYFSSADCCMRCWPAPVSDLFGLEVVSKPNGATILMIHQLTERRADASIAAHRGAVGEGRPSASESARQAARRATARAGSGLLRGHPLDSPNGRPLARPPVRVSQSGDLLASVSRVGTAGRLALPLACLPERTRRARAADVE
jgi:hypothetical protein